MKKLLFVLLVLTACTKHENQQVTLTALGDGEYLLYWSHNQMSEQMTISNYWQKTITCESGDTVCISAFSKINPVTISINEMNVTLNAYESIKLKYIAP